MTKAEEAALKAYPVKGEWVGNQYGEWDADINRFPRTNFQEGYEQAEKDLGWISVIDAIPEYEGWYIVCNDENGKPMNIGVSYRDTTLDKWLDVDGDDDSPGYWMPIPKLPTK